MVDWACFISKIQMVLLEDDWLNLIRLLQQSFESLSMHNVYMEYNTETDLLYKHDLDSLEGDLFFEEWCHESLASHGSLPFYVA